MQLFILGFKFEDCFSRFPPLFFLFFFSLSSLFSFLRFFITFSFIFLSRHMLVEVAWSYRYPPRVSRDKQPKVAAAPRRVREIAWNAQTRLCGRFRSLVRKGKRPTIVATAVARELSAFIWAINREIMGNRQA